MYVYFSDGDNGKGSATVYTKVKFDREQQKEYHVPIVIADTGLPSQSSTNTLTVIIGDENDNKMFPGEKDIFVYSYKSKFILVNQLNLADMLTIQKLRFKNMHRERERDLR